jgi:hypothetical protein
MTSLGLGQFKRRCLAPFECRNGRIVVGSDASYGCKCATDEMTPSACQYCQFQAGGFGQHCTRCLGGLFLQADNRCHDNCAGTGLIEYNPGNCEICTRSQIRPCALNVKVELVSNARGAFPFGMFSSGRGWGTEQDSSPAPRLRHAWRVSY